MAEQQYGEGKDPMMVHRDVATLFKELNVLKAMTVRIQLGSTTITGKLEFTESGCVLAGAAVTTAN